MEEREKNLKLLNYVIDFLKEDKFYIGWSNEKRKEVTEALEKFKTNITADTAHVKLELEPEPEPEGREFGGKKVTQASIAMDFHKEKRDVVSQYRVKDVVSYTVQLALKNLPSSYTDKDLEAFVRGCLSNYGVTYPLEELLCDNVREHLPSEKLSEENAFVGVL